MSSPKLKIGFVVDDTLDKPDGVQQYVLRVGEWLAKQGHEIHYLVGQSSRTDIENVHSLSRNIPVTFNKNHLSIPLPAPKKPIKRLLASENFDILHVQMPYSPFLAAKVIRAASSQTAVIGTFHILPYAWLERVGTRILGKILYRSLRRFDHIFAVSEPAKAFAEASFGVRAKVLPNVVDLAWYRRMTKDQPKNSLVNIVFLGRLVERKGSMQLLKAVASLPTDVQDMTRVTIAGKGPLLARLQAYAVESKIAHIVEFAGFVSEEEKPALLGSADIAVFPATGGESFGIVLLEAMAANAGVVLGGNNPGYASVLSAWPQSLFDPSDTTQFADLLAAYITDQDKRQQLHEAQQQTIPEYDIASVGQKLLIEYQNAIAKRRERQHNKLK
jgi:phosphatidylinositol alpha-mannosyltransferase